MVASLLLGLLLLFAGGDLLVRGSVSLARRIGVSPLLIGLTLVGFGTSTPELVTSLEAALHGSPGIAVGNVVGSNTANILLILGLAALISPILCEPRAFYRDAAAVMLAALACLAVAMAGAMGRTAGGVFIALLASYLVYTYWRERRHRDASALLHEQEAALAEPRPHVVWLSLAFAVGGIALTIGGASLLVNGAIGLAAALGTEDTIVGLTIVAVGTSLPELTASVVASLRRQGDIALGNILGSNIYNVLGILGATAVVHPLAVPAAILRFDVWVMLAATLLLILFATTGRRLSRIEGAVFLLAYAAYVAALAISGNIADADATWPGVPT